MKDSQYYDRMFHALLCSKSEFLKSWREQCKDFEGLIAEFKTEAMAIADPAEKTKCLIFILDAIADEIWPVLKGAVLRDIEGLFDLLAQKEERIRALKEKLDEFRTAFESLKQSKKPKTSDSNDSLN